MNMYLFVWVTFTLHSLVVRFLLERAVVGILQLAIRLMSRETLASQVSDHGCDC